MEQFVTTIKDNIIDAHPYDFFVIYVELYKREAIPQEVMSQSNANQPMSKAQSIRNPPEEVKKMATIKNPKDSVNNAKNLSPIKENPKEADGDSTPVEVPVKIAVKPPEFEKGTLLVDGIDEFNILSDFN